jgi:hypothetical protein
MTHRSGCEANPGLLKRRGVERDKSTPYRKDLTQATMFQVVEAPSTGSAENVCPLLKNTTIVECLAHL